MNDERIIQLYDEEKNELFQMNKGSFSQFVKNFHGNNAVVLFYIMDSLDKRTNIFYGTYSKICEDVNLSRPTVTKAMKHMINLGVITPVQLGVWQVNLENLSNKKSPLPIAEQG